MAVTGVKCPKCGLMQMPRQTCKSCGITLDSTASYPTLPRTGGVPASTGGIACCECGNTFPPDDMIHYEDSWVCGTCKPIFVQKLREGVGLKGALEYAGFWIRLVAKFVDGLVLWLVNILLLFTAGFAAGLLGATGQEMAFVGILYLMQVAIAAAYTIWFLGKYGATPGKMACKLQVVTAHAGRVSYARACGRHFAELLSSIIFFIGYVMAAFDAEKRTLHDRICNTRVVKA
jgi:uncharacterized RDD family membrane protein YckC